MAEPTPDEAWANVPNIPDGESYPARWAARAAAFRAEHAPDVIAYGPGPREALDLFRPEGMPQGLVAVVHGGYWLRFGRRDWSHLAAGALASGWAVAVVGYDLCPQVRIAAITRQVAQAIDRAAVLVPGPLRLVGHSAGGQLVSRMGDAALPLAARGRLARILPVSPVADIAPLRETTMNADLNIDAEEARSESPLHQPAPDCPVHVWVGAAERPVFVAQARALAAAWQAELTIDPGRHHFDVVESLERPDGALTRALLG